MREREELSMVLFNSWSSVPLTDDHKHPQGCSLTSCFTNLIEAEGHVASALTSMTF